MLADGIYMGEGNRDIDYRGKAITVRSESGDPASCVIDCSDDSLHVHIGFYFHSNEGAASVLRGVTVRRFKMGDGILCKHSSPTIAMCVFAENRFRSGVGLFYANPSIVDCLFDRNNYGLLCQESSPAVTGCTFTGHSNYSLSLYYGGPNPGPRIERCTFKGNSGEWDSIIWTRSAMPLFKNCVFADNTIDVLEVIRDNVVIEGCTFEGNRGYSGTGVNLYNSIGAVIRCTFTGNTASGRGGAMSVAESDCTVDSCTFAGNTARLGGAISHFGMAGDLVVRNSVFFGNEAAEDGSCIFSEGRDTYFSLSLELSGNTMAGNSVGGAAEAATAGGSAADGDGAAFRSAASTGGAIGFGVGRFDVGLDRSIIALNSPGCAMNGGASAVDAVVSCCDIFGNAGGDWTGSLEGKSGGNGNISADPLFCDLEGGVLTLCDTSPCLPGNHGSAAECGLMGALGLGCEMYALSLDILPGSCPNPFNMEWFGDVDDGNGNETNSGVLPAAIAGGANFDVSAIDISSIRLEGIEPLRAGMEDVTQPAPRGECACPGGVPGEESGGSPDGHMDLTLKFSRGKLALAIGETSPGDEIVLELTGALNDGTKFVAHDCVRIPGGRGGSGREDAPPAVRLGAASPNPFNPAATIPFSLPSEMHATLSVFNTEGKLVATLVDETLEMGAHTAVWNGADSSGNPVASGVYYYRLRAGASVLTEKMTLLK
ncbi:MAG: hypothetical protein HY770_04235 [Chitinivibrionia bacterium]|nr:hypothetical protein [Chitinivibrionia bacterium]